LRLAATDAKPRTQEQHADTAPTADDTGVIPAQQPCRTRVRREQEARLARKRTRYEEVQALQAQGYSYRAIARRVGLSRETVTRLA
jgi:DNA-binding NarL/FixJ family response regulator